MFCCSAPHRYSSFTHITPGKQGDGWWTGLDVVAQTKEVIPIFKFLHRDKVALFVFDNSTNHSVHPEGALGVFQGVNKGPGGVKAPGSEILPAAGAASGAVKVYRPKMQDGWYLRGGVRVAQQMHAPDTAGDPAKFEPAVVPGVFKGAEAILKERGYFAAEGAKVPLAKCDLKDGDARPDQQCCCRHLLAAQPDFVAQPTALEKLIGDAGHLHKMLPKCHPVSPPPSPAAAAAAPAPPRSARRCSVRRAVLLVCACCRPDHRLGQLLAADVVSPPVLRRGAGAEPNRAVLGSAQGIPAARVRVLV